MTSYKALFFSMLFCLLYCFQSTAQVLRAKVIDANTYRPIVAATIVLEATQQATLTDEQGAFRLEKIPIGRHLLQVSSIGYRSLRIPILVETGKEVVLEISLEASTTSIDTIMIKAPRLEATSPLSTHSITIEETLRLPATFYDPARMITTYAGVVATNDQANHISIRGNSPNHLAWQLEGVEIVNPNHTANAGTITDLPTLNGGGVNMLSTQLLGDSRFYKGNFPTQYGNVIGGLLDMRLRKGNDEQHEFTGQIGLIGIDVAAEGPLNRASNSSYLVNYRYSTLGLLSSFGVELGDEEIKFQDASLHLSFPTKTLGNFTLFGTWGSSSNLFGGQRDTSLQVEQKETSDIAFQSDALILGGTHLLPVGERSLWKTSFAYSQSESERLANNFSGTSVNNLLSQSKIAIHTRYNTQINTSNQLKVGLYYTQYDWLFQENDQVEHPKPGIAGSYINWERQWMDKLKSNIGLHALITNGDFLNGLLSNPKVSTKLQPRAHLAYQINRKQSLDIAYGLHSQQLPYGTLQSHQLGLNYKQSISNNTHFNAEIYWQELFDLPQFSDTEVYGVNIFEISTIESLTPSKNKARNYGMEVSLQRYITDDYYFIANATLYESKFQNENDEWVDTRWNNNYAFNVTGGKEWTKQKKKFQRIFGLNARLAYGGGFRSNPIDISNSDVFLTRYTDVNDFSMQYPDYFKLDLRLYWKRNKAKHNSMFALDILNATNTKNVAFEYYDTVQEKIVTKYQLGLLPILSWRIEL